MIRLATNSDVLALRRAWSQELTGTTEQDPTFEPRLRDWLNQTATTRVTWVAKVGQEPAGMVSVRRYDRMPMPGQPATAWGYLGQLFVLPAHRGAGIGRSLVDAAIAHADTEGWYRLVLSPAEESRPLYARAGFTAADMLLARPGAAAVVGGVG